MMPNPNVKELPIPPEALAAERSVEILRVFVNSDQSLHVIGQPAFRDAYLWGAVLIDIARNAAKMYAASSSLTSEEVLAAIKEVFDGSWDTRTALDKAPADGKKSRK